MTRTWLLIAENYRTRLLCTPSSGMVFKVEDTLVDNLLKNEHLDGEGYHLINLKKRCELLDEPTEPQKKEMIAFVAEIGRILEQRLLAYDRLYLVSHLSMLDRLKNLLPEAVQAKLIVPEVENIPPLHHTQHRIALRTPN